MQQPGTSSSTARGRRIAHTFSVRHGSGGQMGTAKTAVLYLLCAALIGCCQPNDPSCRDVRIGPSGAEVAGVAIGIGAAVATVIAVEVHHAHHTMNGCVSSGAGGMRIQPHGDTRTYILSGNTADITAGDRVRLHGTKVKPAKRSTGEPTFLVEHENKDYGPCKSKLASTTTP